MSFFDHVLRSVLASVVSVGALALTTISVQAAEAHIRVVDVGVGLCVIARTPAGKTMVYDTGAGGVLCRNAVREIVPNRRIDLLVLSHSDADHIGGAVEILAENEVLQVLHPGDDRPLTTASGGRSVLGRVRDAIAAETGATVTSLAETDLDFGHVFDLGAADAVFVAGWSDGHETEGDDEPALTEEGMINNALSIVIRCNYGGHSVLLTGDTVGRAIGNPSSTCRYAEARMVENVQAVPIKSEVLIGQHHGADNASSTCFIEAVSPHFVVFSAGHKFKHLRQTTAERFLFADIGLHSDDLLRTDRRDNEGLPEWRYRALRNCTDPVGDDDVEIFLPDNANEPVRVTYRRASTRCRSSPN